jgi:hypothetical protein
MLYDDLHAIEKQWRDGLIGKRVKALKSYNTTGFRREGGELGTIMGWDFGVPLVLFDDEKKEIAWTGRLLELIDEKADNEPLPLPG